MAKPYDATLKQILDDHAADWFAWFAADLGLPAGPVEPLDAESSTVTVAADKVFRLPAGAGLLHLEVQSSWDGELPDRLLEYHVALHRRFGGPVHSLVILLRPEANAAALTGRLVRQRADGRPLLDFRYDVIRVWELPADALLAGGIGTTALGLLTDDARDRLPELVRQYADRIEREVAAAGLRSRMLTEANILLGLRYDKSWVDTLFAGVQKMRESSTYQGILEEGRAEGRAEGQAEGRVEGRVEGLRLSLTTLLEQRFGRVGPELEARIRQATDAARLQAALRQVFTIPAADEVVL